LSFAAAWLAALAVAMGDLAASIITTPPGVTTVSIRVFGLMHAGVRSQEAGVCLISTAGFVVVAAGVMRLLGWRRIVPASDPRNRPALRGSSR
jgi:ABC-type spermidine/putrescine transport system permease subunit II